MKILQINTFGNTSTGRIVVDIYRTLVADGHEGMVAFARNSIPDDVAHIKIGNTLNVYMDGILTRITDQAGFFSRRATKKLIMQIKDYSPDIIHLHNVHGYYINVELLFKFLKEYQKPVVWTLHDCWSFTGHCCNFESIGCQKWSVGCHDCQQKRRYPASIWKDNSSKNYKRKKELFTGLDNMTLVVPSFWLKGLLEESFMKKYPIRVLRNGVDLNIFKPTYGEWIKRMGLLDKKIVLGVAGTWTPTKGLDDFIKLADELPSEYQVVVVGVDRRQKEQLPTSIIGIERTYDSRELAEIYTAAQVFVNPTYDDNFPNVNIEALACGTPVITYQTGGSPEVIDETNGRVVEKGNIEQLRKEILKLGKKKNICLLNTQQYERNRCYGRYLDLYKEVIKC